MKRSISAILLLMALQACGGGGSSSSTPQTPDPVPTPVPAPDPAPDPTPVVDNTPDMFSFGQFSQALPSSLVESDAILVTGIDDGTDISIVNGEFSIDGSEYQSDASNINNGQKVSLRALSSVDSLGQVSVSVTIGDLVQDYTITTADISGRVEAESATLMGNAQVDSLDLSSLGQIVSLQANSDGLSLNATKAAKMLSIAYASNAETMLTVLLEGTEIATANLYPTAGKVQTTEVFFDFVMGNEVEILLNTVSNNTEVSIDYIDFVGEFNAQMVASQMGSGFNLGQMFESTQHDPSLANAAPKIDAYYKNGFRNVRIPITWTEEIQGSTLVEDTDTGVVNRNHPRLAELIDVVDYALAKPGMFVVINAHHESTLKLEDKYQVLEQIWEEATDIFADRSHRLLFEILNEPHQGPNNDPMEPAKLRRMTELSYNKIRAQSPNRIIIIGGNQWFGAHEMADTWPNLDQVGGGQDANIMATFHHYDPWEFNGEGNKTFAWNAQNISSPMQTMEAWSNDVGNGMPIYIGEWGNSWNQYLQADGCNNISSWYNDFGSEHAQQRPITAPTAVWDDGGWFQIWNHDSDDWGSQLYQCIIGNCLAESFERNNSACTDTK